MSSPSYLRGDSCCLLRVIGVGNAGSNIVDLIEKSGALAGAEMAVVNSDQLALSKSSVANQFCLGVSVLRGLGAGGDPDQGRAAAEADSACLKASLLDWEEGSGLEPRL
jgi:cell division protein FtsZ